MIPYQRSVMRVVFGPAVLALFALAASQAQAGFSLGDAASYAVLQYNSNGSGQTTFSISGGSTEVTGNNQGLLGSAANTKVNFSGETPSISLYQSTVNTGGNNYNGVTVNMSTAITANLAQAVTDANSAATTYAGLTATQTVGSTVTGGQTFTGNGSLNVIDLTMGINMTGSTGITISGGHNDTFIFNVSSQFTSNNGTSITLNGVSASQIIWNYEGTSAVSFTGGSTTNNFWDGTILSPNAQIMAHDRTFNGALISGQNISITSNPVFNFQPFTPQCVPEPSTFVLALAALLSFGVFKLRRFCR